MCLHLCVFWNFWLFTDSRAIGSSRKSSDSVLQQQPSSAGPTGRSTPTSVAATTVSSDAPHSPMLEDVPTSKADNITLTVKSCEEDSSADKPTMNWEPQNAEENGSSTLQNSEFNLDLDDILKIDSLPLLTVSILLVITGSVFNYLFDLFLNSFS